MLSKFNILTEVTQSFFYFLAYKTLHYIICYLCYSHKDVFHSCLDSEKQMT